MDTVRIGPDGRQSAGRGAAAARALEELQEREARLAQDAAAILEALAPAAQVLAVEKEIEVNGVPHRFFIKRLSYEECSRLEARRYRRGADGTLQRDLTHEETIGIAWQIHSAVLRRQEAPPGPVRWEPLFALDQVLGGDGRGLMDNPHPAAAELVYALTAAIWEVNPALNPFVQAAAAARLGME